MNLDYNDKEKLDNTIVQLQVLLSEADETIDSISSAEKRAGVLSAVGRIGLALAELLKLKASLG